MAKKKTLKRIILELGMGEVLSFPIKRLQVIRNYASNTEGQCYNVSPQKDTVTITRIECCIEEPLTETMKKMDVGDIFLAEMKYYTGIPQRAMRLEGEFKSNKVGDFVRIERIS